MYHGYYTQAGVTPAHYHQLLKVAEAKKTLEAFNGYVEQKEDVIEVDSHGVCTRYNPNGTIEVRWSRNHFTERGERNFVRSSALPDGIEWFGFSHPEKHYLKITHGDQVRYWLLPKLAPWDRDKTFRGLTLVPHEELGYVPMQPIQDYRHILDRKGLKYYREVKYAAVLSKLDKFWSLLDATTRVGFIPLNLDDEQTWIPHFTYVKTHNEPKSVVRDIILERIRNLAPTMREPIEPTTFHHNKYWHY